MKLPVDTSIADIEDAFKSFTSRDDIAIILINQNVRISTMYFDALSSISRLFLWNVVSSCFKQADRLSE